MERAKSDTRGLQVTTEAPTCFAVRGAGRWFIDFGQAMFGTVQLTIRADDTGSCDVCLGEKLLADGTIDRAPPGCIRCRVLTLPLKAGLHTYRVAIPPDERNTGPEAVLMPDTLFEVLPFRYAEVTVRSRS